VSQIIAAVRHSGDAALFNYTYKIDGVELTALEISREKIDRAQQEVSPQLLDALKLAAEQIRRFHVQQKHNLWGGNRAIPGQRIRPLERVGLYVPGGTAAYPSTVLMTAVPAKVAEVNEVILTTPPRADGSVPALTLAAADIAGVDRVFSLGGAQAIAAMAFGTTSVPKVDKICGPGNIFVVLAKKMVYGAVDIDGLQGPSEVIIIADETASAEYCAADLMAQAEHDTVASSIVITTSAKLAQEIDQEVTEQLKDLPRQTIAAESLQERGYIVVVSNLDEAVELSNLYAPEHLCLLVSNAAPLVDKVSNAGTVFTGPKATVVLGDYDAGPSHVLPTGGTARFSSPLNIGDFLKIINLIEVTDASLKELGPAAISLARAEGFEAHARAVEKRLRQTG
jgi:histidinol dehydrogenase